MTSNMASEGWLKKTNFIEDGKDPTPATIQLEVACHHASHYLLHGIREYSQLFCGTNNTVANALSWEDGWSNKELTQIFTLTALPSFSDTSK
jgi:hypothetical protein